MGTALFQNEPVRKTRPAARASSLRPSAAESGWPLAIALEKQDQVRLEPEEPVRPTHVQAETATHVVEDEHRALAAAGGLHALEETRRG